MNFICRSLVLSQLILLVIGFSVEMPTGAPPTCADYSCMPPASIQPAVGTTIDYSVTGCDYEEISTTVISSIQMHTSRANFATMWHLRSYPNCLFRVVYFPTITLYQNPRADGCNGLTEGDYIRVLWGSRRITFNSLAHLFHISASRNLKIFYRGDSISGSASPDIHVVSFLMFCGINTQEILPPFDPVLPGIDGCEGVTEESILMEVDRIKDAILKDPNNITEVLNMFGARETECYCYGTCISKDEEERNSFILSFFENKDYLFKGYLNSPDELLRHAARMFLKGNSLQSPEYEDF